MKRKKVPCPECGKMYDERMMTVHLRKTHGINKIGGVNVKKATQPAAAFNLADSLRSARVLSAEENPAPDAIITTPNGTKISIYGTDGLNAVLRNFHA